MQKLLFALIIALGVSLGGWFIGQGFLQGQHDRYVTVKGLAEQDVSADLALWPLKIVAAGNDLKQVQQKIQNDIQQIQLFLEQYGLADSITSSQISVVDKAAQTYGNEQYLNRFIISKELLIRSTHIDNVQKAAQNTSQLISAGIILDSQYGNQSNQPVFLFDGLNQLKPSMIAKATANAKQAAEQFAQDSNSRLDGIRQANQGVFQILARDKAPMLNASQQALKTVRVVVTIQYRLKN